MASPLYPDVPFALGVPPVLRNITNTVTASIVTRQFQDDVLRNEALPGARAPQVVWGIYDANGALALQPDNIVSIEPLREFRISDYPVEGGGFQSFNKVATPGDVRFAVTKGGSASDRQAFLERIDVLIASLDLYNIITPDYAYLDYSLTRYDYRRSAANGATLLTVELLCQEVRQTATAKFTSSKDASGASVSNAGPVQTATPTASQTPKIGPPA